MSKSRYPYKGMEIHEIKPIILGGSPTDHSNKVLVPRDKYDELVSFWNRTVKRLYEKEKGYPIITDYRDQDETKKTLSDIKPFLKNFETNPPTHIEEIHNVEKEFGFKFPEEYVEFMLWSNGGEGEIGYSYFALWTIEEVLSLNTSYSVCKFAPGIIVFGSNGGGNAYGFDTNQEKTEVICMPFIGMTTVAIDKVSKSFYGFFNFLANSE